MVPHRYPAKTLPTRSDTDSPAPRSSSMRALDASAALATRARSIAAPTPCPPRREARRPGRYAPRRRRRAERSTRDLGRCAKKANEEKRRRNVDASFRVRHGGRKTLPSPLWGVFDLFPKAELSNRATLLPNSSQLERATQRCAPPPPDAGAFETRPPSGARARTALPLAPAARARVVPPFPRDRPSRAENDQTNPVRIAK